jgi:hypothetical protein
MVNISGVPNTDELLFVDNDGTLHPWISAGANDGISLAFYAGNSTTLTPVDTDGDASGTGAVDYLDNDSDNDGTLDSVESGFILTGIYGINGLDS